MQKAANVPVSTLAVVTIRFIDNLLANRPAGLSSYGYKGDESSTITGYDGIQVYFHTYGSRRSRGATINLYVSGPERLVAAVIQQYKDRYSLSSRGHGYASLRITD